MLKTNKAIIVEGKYDKIKLASIIDAVIIKTDGFKIFKDEEKKLIIKHFAKNSGIIILTDSDTAGFKIRNYIKSFVKDGKIINVYIPDIFGKEKRKNAPSKEGKLGVEGINADILREVFQKAGVLDLENNLEEKEKITVVDFYDDGLMGGQNSSYLRKKLLEKLELPSLLSTKSTLEIINTMLDKSEYRKIVKEI